MDGFSSIPMDFGDIQDFDPMEADCLSCSEILSLHQPDPNRPEDLLGVCPCCQDWYLLQASEDGRIDCIAFIDRIKLIATARGDQQVQKRHPA